ncbi:hypothetical protein ACGFNV_46280 [Streptomyces sp. NPDC048751]|uniref:hypothetical protein n=1 Tax=Streptomyces sp. NPDC048751 TaxID=3365591 RepID=UPI00371DE650
MPTAWSPHVISPAVMRRRAGKFLTALPPVDATPARDWRSTVGAVLAAQLPPSKSQLRSPKILSLATKELDQPIGSLIGLSQSDSHSTPAAAMRSSTVHQAKGSEADAVLVHLEGI